ncbi:glycosyltransferase family 4 protein, partial [Carboxydocella sp. JDF658]|uniref:glycosyltransferase family 4 protein n=1 Tax=Carboxydocella sp. JDF658 TaxID=1926600 RepID=UPI0009AC5EDD
MKILMINKFYYIKGGAEKCFFNQINLFLRNNIDYCCFSMKHEKNFTYKYQDLFANEIDFDNMSIIDKIINSQKIIFNFNAYRKIKNLINITKPDIAHLHNIYHHLSPSIIYALKEKNIPIVITLHDFKLVCPTYNLLCKEDRCDGCFSIKNKIKAMYKKCHKQSFINTFILLTEFSIHNILKTYHKNIDYFITPSYFLYDKLIKYGYPKEKIIVLPNFVKREFLDTNFRINNNRGYCLYFGRLSKEKGIYTLLKAFLHLKDKTLYIVGNGPEENNVRKFILNYGLSNVKILGFLEEKQLKSIIKNSLFVILPSICHENCSMAILEAMALGKPVIASNTGGTPEIVTENYNGLLFNPGNVDELIDKINYLYYNKELISVMSKNAIEKINKKYTEEIYFSNLLSIY